MKDCKRGLQNPGRCEQNSIPETLLISQGVIYNKDIYTLPKSSKTCFSSKAVLQEIKIWKGKTSNAENNSSKTREILQWFLWCRPRESSLSVAEEEDGGEGMEPTDLFPTVLRISKIIERCLTNLLEHLENKLSMHTSQTKQMKK